MTTANKQECWWENYFIICEAEQFLPKAVVLLFSPLIAQELDDFVVARYEHIAVSPDRVCSISIFYLCWIPETC